MKKAIYPLLAIVIASSAIAGQVYKWTDAQGKVYYSDIPPPAEAKAKTQTTTTIKPATGPGAAPVVASKASAASSVKGASGVQASAVQASAVQEKSEKNPQACQQARARKTFLESGQIAKVLNDKGQPVFMDAEKRKAELTEVNKDIARVCP